MHCCVAEAQAFIAEHSNVASGSMQTGGSSLGKRSHDGANAGSSGGCSNQPASTAGYASKGHTVSERKHAPSSSAFYAVANGSKPGIYTRWQDVEPLVKECYSAKYKKVDDRAAAEAFIREFQELKRGKDSDPNPRDSDTLVAFCDGSAIGNGRAGCRAGWACVFPHRQEWNRSEALQGFQTNNRAEYTAALEAMRRANAEDSSQTKPLFIFSDSMLLIRSMTEWLSEWARRNWIKADGSQVKNKDLLAALVSEQGNRRVVWRHVKAHTGRSDWQSKWNHCVDEMAREAAVGRTVSGRK